MLTFDFEDWHQLVYQQIGRADWRTTGYDGFGRHVSTVLDLLDELGVRATFFATGVTAERHPEALAAVVASGHEVGCHGYDHVRVYEQTPDEFRRDVVRCVDVVERVCGVTPVGYRAPWCSITRDSQWAHDVLRELGFRYDSSLFDSPRVRNRIRPIPPCPYVLRGDADTLWEFPLAVCHWGRLVLPVSGGAYWRVLPNAVLRRALDDLSRRTAFPVLYFHPYEFASEPLRIALPRHASGRERIRETWRYVWQNTRRRLIEPRLREAAARFRLVPVRDVYPVADDDSDTPLLRQTRTLV